VTLKNNFYTYVDNEGGLYRRRKRTQKCAAYPPAARLLPKGRR